MKLYVAWEWETSGTIYFSLPLIVHPSSAPSTLFIFVSTLPDLTFLDGMVAIEYMRGPVALALLPAKCWFRQMYSMNGTPGLLATSTPKKQEKNESDKTGLATTEMIDPIVAFSRPPSLPPVIGPLVAFSLLETWWNRGTDEDG